MTADPFTCLLNAEIELALQVMTSCRVRRLLVVDQRGKLAGIVSLTDILESMNSAFDFDVPLLRRPSSRCARSAGRGGESAQP